MTVSTNSQRLDHEPGESFTIRMTEITVLHYPVGDYDYRVLIRAHDEGGSVLAEQRLPTRRRPEWLVNAWPVSRGSLTIALQARLPDDGRWQAVGRVVLDPQQHLNGQSHTAVVTALRDWDAAPQLQVRVRLAKDRTDRPNEPETNRPGELSPSDSDDTSDNRFVAQERAVSRADGPEPAPLTAAEQVIVKDVWNKFLAFQDMLIGMFFERLLHEEPDLADSFGDAIDLVPGYFAQLFDQSVRQLMPHTERVLRESYRGVHPAPPAGAQTVEECVSLLADLGMRPNHWLTARLVWTWVLSEVPYLEDYDRENLAKGVQSAPYRFFTLAILPPALTTTRRYAEALTPALIRAMRRGADVLAADALATGTDFYRILFQTHPEIIPYFGRTDVDRLAEHLMQTVAFLIRSLEAGRDVTTDLRDLSRAHTNAGVPAEAYPKLIGPMLAVMRARIPDFTSEQEHAWTTLLRRVSNVLQQPILSQQRVLNQAREFIGLIADELGWEPTDRQRRLDEIEREIRTTGTYTHTYEELAYGGQVAWRNAAKCIGRIAWRTLMVRDLRHVTDPDDMFRECTEHLRLATNGGNLQSIISVFRPKKPRERWGPRIWNGQYIRFAAYEQPDGTILGDAANRALTKALIRQGWTPPAVKTPYDCLPLAIEVPGQPPKLYSFAPDDVRMVPIEHPQYPNFKDLNLQWCAVPAIANFQLEIGGIHYGCTPFNGWFMETEIARDLWEEGRYNRAEAIAEALGLDTSSEQTLWRDRGLLELNAAILHSFSKAKITLVDHQTASRQFLTHDLREKRSGRECPAQWSWVVPSLGGSSTPVWHHEMRDFFLSPSYHYAADKWAVVDAEIHIPGNDLHVQPVETTQSIPAPRPAPRTCPFHHQHAPADHRSDDVFILYGSETGTAESYARQAARRLSRHRPRVLALDECEPADLAQSRLVLVVTSTFGNGELPGNARQFLARIAALPDDWLKKLDYSVMALGSTVYPHFCAAGITLDRELARVGGNRVVSLHRGDEIRDQAGTFRQWLDLVARLLGEDPTRVEPPADEVRLRVSFRAAHSVPTSVDPHGRRRLPGQDVPVLANRELLAEVLPGSRSTRFLAFDLTGTDLTYETGDHVAIYPHNPPALVQRICDRLEIDVDAYFTTALVNRAGLPVAGPHPYPEPTRVGQVLTEELDLALREPFNEIIDALLKTAHAADDRNRLEAWRDALSRVEPDEASRTLRQTITDQFATLADLLDSFPSATLSFAQLIELLPKQKPRLYSISSSPLVYPHQIHVTVGVLERTTGNGQTRTGLCSGYLAGLDPAQGARVRLAVRTSAFRPPRNPQTPLLLVGPGTGLSPLIGFLQHREAQLRAAREANGSAMPGDGAPSALPVRPGYARLYFGCRNWNDYLYRQDLETWHQTGLLTHLHVAFSRFGPQRTYVQHLIEQHSPAVWKILQQPNCHVYVCGDAQMADAVLTTLMTIARTTGGLSHAEAVEFFRTMQTENRLMMDVWGVVLHFRNALADVQEAKYAQGERWLERLTAELGQ